MTVGVEDLRRAMFCQCLFQSVYAEVGIPAAGQPPGKHLATEPIHDRHKIEEATPHRNVGDSCAPDVIGSLDHNIFQKIGPYLVLRVLLARVGLLVNRHRLVLSRFSFGLFRTMFAM